MDKTNKAAARKRLLEALGQVASERMVYEYDATWHCERQSDTWYDCPEGTEQDTGKRLGECGMMRPDQYQARRDEAQEAANRTKGMEWCRSCKAKQWLAEHPPKAPVPVERG